MELINLTPHDINIISGDEKTTIKASGTIARCALADTLVKTIAGVPVFHQIFGEIEGLPGKKEGVIYIVSRIVADAAKAVGRTDVLCPASTIKDTEGHIIGCKGLSI